MRLHDVQVRHGSRPRIELGTGGAIGDPPRACLASSESVTGPRPLPDRCRTDTALLTRSALD